jgi:hypothetical protein
LRKRTTHSGPIPRTLALLPAFALALALALAACEGDSGPGGAGGGGGDHRIEVVQAGDPIPDGGTYFTPINAAGNKIPLFSEHPGELMTIRNTSNGPVLLNSVTIAGQGNAQPEEWRLETTDIRPTPLEVEGLLLQPDDRLDFYARFTPLEGTPRSAIVVITYDTTKTYQFTLRGEGAPAATFLASARPAGEWLLGRPGEDEQAGAMVADPAGNVYFTANHETANDRIFVGRVDAGGNLAWVKAFDGPYSDRQLDPGQNSETGGAAGSLALGPDGYLYVTGTYSWTSSNNSFYAWVAKIEPATGALVWSRLWSAVETISIASHSSVAYAIDASAPDRVLVTGTTQGEAQVLLFALAKRDGAALFGASLELAATVNDRGYAVRYAGGGVAYVAGQTAGNGGFVMRLTGVDGATPAVEWTRRIELGTGGNVNAVDVDDAGNLYATLDVRGALTIFGFASFDAAGTLRWAKGYAGNDGDKHNAHVIRHAGGRVYVGGRTAQVGCDGQMGDGNVVVVNAADGAPLWSANYYGGKGAEELAEHRVKGLALTGTRLMVSAQVYSGTNNGAHYWGMWYEGLGEVVDFVQGPDTSALTATLTPIDGGGFVRDVSEATTPFSATWTDAAELVWQAPRDKLDGTPPDADLILFALEL